MNAHTGSQNFLVKPSLGMAARTTAINGIGVDCLGYDRATVLLHVGSHDYTTTDETLDVTIEESDDNSTFVAISGSGFAQVKAQTVTATQGIVFLKDINLEKRKRYLRAVGTPGGTTPIDTYTVDFLLFRGQQLAPTQDNTVTSL